MSRAFPCRLTPPEQLENIDPPPIEYNGKTLTYYECTQKQRTMETAMRKTKREIIAAKASGDEDMFTAKSILLRRQKEEYAKFSKSANMLTQNERTQVYGFDRSISAKAAWTVKKAQNTSGGSPAPASSGGKAVTLDVPAPASSGTGKVYTGEKIVKPLDNSGGNGIMNKAKPLDMFNDSAITFNSPITTQQIIDELSTTSIGRTILNDIDNLPERVKLTYDYKSGGVRGEQNGGEITIYLSNCINTKWAARSVIHEVTHYKYGIGQSQWAECVCVAQELKHARNRDYLTVNELRTIISAVKDVYPNLTGERADL